MSTTTNTARKPATKGVRASGKISGKSQPVAKDKPGETLTAPEPNNAVEFAARIGDNERPYYTALETVFHDVRGLATKFDALTGVNGSKSLALVMSLYSMRDMKKDVDIADMAMGRAAPKTGGKVTSAKERQEIWLKLHSVEFDAADKAASITDEKLSAIPDSAKREKEEHGRDAAKLARERMRVMFERAVIATYYLIHMNVSEVEESKGKIAFRYTVDGKVEPGSNSVSGLVRNGRAIINAAIAKRDNVAPKGPKGAGSKSKPAVAAKSGETQTKSHATTAERIESIKATAKSMTDNLGGLTVEEQHTAVTSPVMDTLAATNLVHHFGQYSEARKLIRFDVGALLTWLHSLPELQTVAFINEPGKTEIVTKEEAAKSGIVPAAGKTGTAK